MKTRNIVAVIDVGSTKICCCIARVSADDQYEIIGVGYCMCVGMNYGVISNIDFVERSIAIAVENAEKMADVRVSSAFITVSGKNVRTRIVNLSLDIGGRIVAEQDVSYLLQMVKMNNDQGEIIHSIPILYSIDSLHGIKDPVGMVANKLSVDLNVVSVPRMQIKNLLLCLARCHLSVDGIIASAYAAGIGVMDQDDMVNSRTVIDFGGKMTTVAFFFNGVFCGSFVIPLGGNDITKDIAYNLNTSEENAERIKVLHGAAILSVYDEIDKILAPIKESDDIINLQEVSKASLNQIIHNRVVQILTEVKRKIEKSCFQEDFLKCVIVTGGGSLLTGMRDITSEILKTKVQIKKIRTIVPGCDIQINNDFAVVLGMLRLANSMKNFENTSHSRINDNNFISKTIKWFKNHL